VTPTPLPDWKSRRALIVLALGVTLVVAVKLWLHKAPLLDVRLGDSDDAMRLVLVRDLLAGRGWFDQHLMRLQPPQGVYLHWSRLLDGALAGYDSFLRAVLSPQAAERAMRATWPMLWLFPTITAGLVIVRRIGGALALTAGALLFLLCSDGYGQFAPGRIDHHNVQIALCVIAAAGAVWAAESWIAAAIAGAATGLGLAIGIEGLFLYATLGAGMALGLVFGKLNARAVTAYGLALAGAAAAAFLAQTPPTRWGVSVCDALGLNLTAGLILAGLGLAGVALATRNRAPLVRGIAAGAVGLVAAGVFLALDPRCAGGPVAAVDPSIRGIWLATIDEMRPLSFLLAHDFARGAALAAPAVLGLVAWAWIGRRRAGRTFEWALMGACLVVAAAAMAAANRMGSYVVWFAVPPIAAAATELALAYGRGLLISGAALSVLFAPPAMAWTATTIAHELGPHAGKGPASRFVDQACLDVSAFRTLAKAPPGLVLASPNLGPFILAETPHSVLAAPYHRMAWGIVLAHDLLGLHPDEAEDAVRAAKIDYVAACASGGSASGSSLQARLAARAAPAWLEPLSPPSDALQVYRVRPSPLPSSTAKAYIASNIVR
jgi:hypothetical protein